MTPQSESGSASVPGFPPTQWTLLLQPIKDCAPGADAALEQLCSTYWKPLYEFVRRRGYDHHAAEDITQEFITMLIRREDLARLRRGQGRFRSFLLVSLRHFLINRHRKEYAEKRGAGLKPVSLHDLAEGGRLDLEPADRDPIEREFDREWAWELIQRATLAVEQEYVAAGKRASFDDLKCFLVGPPTAIPRAELAARHGVDANALDVAIHRLRKRFGKALRERVAETVESAGDVTEELHYLMSVIGS
jgi:RNA polymerase sigma-70 factor (ECF subfamily)